MTNVLFVASEAYPLAKTGGLGDVAGALPRALIQRGIDVRLVLPAYTGMARLAESVVPGPPLPNLLRGYSAQLLSGRMPGTGVPLWLVDCPALYARDGNPYCGPDSKEWPDNHLRFGLLARAAAAIAMDSDVSTWRPHIVHGHDWHAGLVPYYIALRRAARPRTVFTVHNMAYQGVFDSGVMPQLDIAADSFTPQGLEFWGKVSFLKAGLVYSDRITTVSPTYAEEIQQAPEGSGLEGVLHARNGDVAGILNGIDDETWDPSRDSFIAHPYSLATLARKQLNTAALRAELKLPDAPTNPLIAVVSRLVEQKGIDVLAATLPAILSLGVQVAILGAGEAKLEQLLKRTASDNKDGLVIRLGYDESLAHRMIAGADLLLVPSRYEPCGLTQLYGQRYGTPPIVHSVGGLADTVHDGRDGFAFSELTPHALLGAVRRALKVYEHHPSWRLLQERAMCKKLGWDACARRYIELYDELLSPRLESHTLTKLSA